MEKMEIITTNIANSSILADAFLDREKKFKVIQSKAGKCMKKNEDIQVLRNECNNVFEVVLKNLYPERKQLDMFLLNWSYRDYKENNQDKRYKNKWIKGKKNIPEDAWGYSEVCLNPIGLTFLQIGGQKSFSIIENDIDRTIYNLTAVKGETDVMDKIKAELKPEKFELFSKMLEDIEILNYEDNFNKELIFSYKELGYGGIFKNKQHDCTKMKIELEGNAHCELLSGGKQKRNNMVFNQNNTINLINPSFEGAIILEQISEQTCQTLDEYNAFLDIRKQEITNYTKSLKDKFFKTLMYLKLQEKEKKNA